MGESISLGSGQDSSPGEDGSISNGNGSFSSGSTVGTSLGMMGGGGEDTLLKAGAMLLILGGATSETGIGLGIAATALAILAADQVIKKTKEIVKAIEEEKTKNKYYRGLSKEDILDLRRKFQIQSKALRNGNNPFDLINENKTLWISRHQVNSNLSGGSPFVSVTKDFNEAIFFATHGQNYSGIVGIFEINNAIPNPNKPSGMEYFVPGFIPATSLRGIYNTNTKQTLFFK